VDADVPKDEHPDVAIEAGAIEGAVTVGTVGTVGTMLPVTSGAAAVGSSAAELTPRLPISVESRGMPILGLPPVVVGAVELGLEDAAILLEPEPHMPDMPAVSSAPGVVDIPEVIPDVDDIDEVAAIPDDMSIDATVFPAAPPATGVDPAIAIPPPS
jgi:hypothetical protein